MSRYSNGSISHRDRNVPQNLEEENEDPDARKEVPEELKMALNQEEINALIDEHLGYELVGLRDLIDDYNPEDLTQIELTEFAVRLREIRTKLQSVRQGFVKIVIHCQVKRMRQPDKNKKLLAKQPMSWSKLTR